MLSVAAAVLLLAAILNRWLFKPLNGILAERREQTEAAQRSLQEARQAQEARLAEIEKRLAEARREAYEIRDVAQREGHERQEALLREARADAQEILDAARAEIAADIESAQVELEAQADRLAGMVAERLAGRPLESAGENS